MKSSKNAYLHNLVKIRKSALRRGKQHSKIFKTRFEDEIVEIVNK